jgi:hypothetical protein
VVVVPFCCSRVTKATMDVAVSDTCQIQWGAMLPDFEANRDVCMVRHTVGGINDWFAGRTNASGVVVFLSLLLLLLLPVAPWALWLLPWTVWLGSSSSSLASMLHASGVVDSTATDSTDDDDDDDDSSALQTASSIHGRWAALCPTNKSLMAITVHTQKGYSAQFIKNANRIFENQTYL